MEKTNLHLESVFSHIEAKDAFFGACIFLVTLGFLQMTSWGGANQEGFHASAGLEQHIKELEIQIQELRSGAGRESESR